MSRKTKTTAPKEETTPELVPKLRFPEFREAEEWKKAALGELMEITSSKRVHESDWAESGVPFYRAREIVALNNGEPISPLFISEDLYRENAKKSGAIVPGDLLVSGVGSIGIPYLVKPNDRFYFKDGNIIWLKNRDTKLQGQFLLTLYSTRFVQRQIKTMAGVGTVGTYTIENANKTVAVFPVDATEQQKIAECLSSVDVLMAAQARKLDALKTHKKGLMQQLFPREGETQPRLRFPEFQNAGTWSKMTLGEAASFYNGRAYKQEELLDFGKYPVLRVGNFFTSNTWYHSDLELDKTKYCEDGDLLYAWSASFGPRVWRGKKSIYHYHIWKVIEKRGIDKQFLFITLENETENMKAKTTNGLGIMHITKGAIESWETNFPKIAEQRKIAGCITSLDNTITAEIQKLEALISHKKGLMQQLFPSPDCIQV